MLSRAIPADDQRPQNAQPNQRLRDHESVYRNRLTWAVCSIGRTLRQGIQLEQRYEVKEPRAWETENRDPETILDQYRIPGLPGLPTASCKQTDTWAGSLSNRKCDWEGSTGGRDRRPCAVLQAIYRPRQDGGECKPEKLVTDPGYRGHLREKAEDRQRALTSGCQHDCPPSWNLSLEEHLSRKEHQTLVEHPRLIEYLRGEEPLSLVEHSSREAHLWPRGCNCTSCTC